VAKTGNSSDHRVTEASNSSSTDLDLLDSAEIVRLMNAEDAKVVAAVAERVDAIGAAVDALADRLRQGGRMFYVGAGTSGRLGILDASECPPTFSSDPEMVQGVIAGGPRAVVSAVEGAEDDVAQAAIDLDQRQLRAGDCVVGIAASGSTPYVLGAMQHARTAGCLTVAVTCNVRTPLAELADHPLEVVVGAEVLTGSTRLKSGTATKMVLNMLSTGVMVRLGKTYQNLMVDLQATNAKLRTRAMRLLLRLTDLDPDAAQELMAACDGSLKVSVVAARLGLSPAQAHARLAENDGGLRAALSETSRS